MVQLDPKLLARAEQWLSTDPDPDTAAELKGIMEAAQGQAGDSEIQTEAIKELDDAFAQTLSFGTAGLRGALGAGPNRMNRVMVRRATAALATFLNRTVREVSQTQEKEAATSAESANDGSEQAATSAPSGSPRARAIVGFDTRRNSQLFAQDTAAVLTAAGIETYVLPGPLPTPVLAFAMRALNCDGGVMITASHNPANDNGYKVYLGGRVVPEASRGAQITPPYDSQIAEYIDVFSDVTRIPVATEGWQVLSPDAVVRYQQGALSVLHPNLFPSRNLRIVHTALHGVSGILTPSTLVAAGFKNVLPVAAQQQPDPNFSTVFYPNPEEPNTLDLAIATAQEAGADIVLANDPDADRLAVVAVDPETERWRQLTGDELGTLIGAHLLWRMYSDPQAAGSSGVFANSLVSSRMLKKLAEDAGIKHKITLTGFKWIAQVPNLIYGYEEALGYCVAPNLVKDKDGISAALLISELAASLKAQDKTLFDQLDSLALRYGLHLSDQISVRVADQQSLDVLLNRLVKTPPLSFAGSQVTEVQDLSEGYQKLPPTKGVLYLTENDTRVIIRPSGTEPKLKCYVEVIGNAGSPEELASTRQNLQQNLTLVRADLQTTLGL